MGAAAAALVCYSPFFSPSGGNFGRGFLSLIWRKCGVNMARNRRLCVVHSRFFYATIKAKEGDHVFILYNPNPRKRMVADCTVRAICKATGYTWDDVYISLFVEGLEKADMPSSNDVWGGYLRKIGWTRTSIMDNCPDCYSVADFAREHPDGTYILALEKHVVCVHNGDWYDTWNSGQERVHFIWQKED